MNELYRSIGISKQAVHQQAMRQSKLEAQMIILVREAEDLRREHPGCGLEKMYHTLAPDFIGRDRFIEFFMRLGYRVKNKRAYHRTTYAGSHYYPNLITGMLINGPSQISSIEFHSLSGLPASTMGAIAPYKEPTTVFPL